MNVDAVRAMYSWDVGYLEGRRFFFMRR